MLDKLKYRKPNFNREWLEANRYPEFQEIGKRGWLELAPNGSVVRYSNIKEVLGNVNLDFDSLERDKKQRFIEAYKTGVVEVPIAVKFNDFEYDLVGGNTRLAGLVRIGHDPKIWVVQAPGWDYDDSEESITEKWSEKYKDSIDCSNPKGFSQKAHCQGKKKMDTNEDCWDGYKQVGMKSKGGKQVPNCVPKKGDTNEVTGASSSGAYVGAMTMTKGDVEKIHNSKLNEAIDSGVSAAAAYDVPLFGANPRGGRKDPLKIDGPESIGKGRAVKDKNFPKWGGPGGVFIKIKEKCKKFPYCNQGDINNIEILRESINELSKKHGLSTQQVENIVLKGIKDIFI